MPALDRNSSAGVERFGGDDANPAPTRVLVHLAERIRADRARPEAAARSQNIERNITDSAR